jgi:hypothetical protein
MPSLIFSSLLEDSAFSEHLAWPVPSRFYSSVFLLHWARNANRIVVDSKAVDPLSSRMSDLQGIILGFPARLPREHYSVDKYSFP